MNGVLFPAGAHIALQIALRTGVIYLVVIRFFTPLMLMVLLALPTLSLAWQVYRRPKPALMTIKFRRVC